jgi:hypothetical protein
MSDDRLRVAARALRETGAPPPGDVARVRVRVLDALGKERRRRSRVVTWVLPIAAVFACTTAWAARSGRLALVLRALGGGEERAAPSAPPAAEVPVVKPAEAPPPGSSAAVAAAPPAAPAPSVPPSASPTIRKRSTQESDDDGASADVTDYRPAHALFFAGDYAAALPAFDAYLAHHPGAALAVEARYNRAICLVQLGRVDEARAALAPFAAGRVAGGYRQAEAAALLDALEGRPR